MWDIKIFLYELLTTRTNDFQQQNFVGIQPLPHIYSCFYKNIYKIICSKIVLKYI